MKKIFSYPIIKIEKNNQVNFAKPSVDDEMTCPFCGQPLKKIGEEHIMSLEEHVYAPNSIPSKKPVGVCVNNNCKFRHYFKYSLYNGEAYHTAMYDNHFFDNNFNVKTMHQNEFEELNTYRISAGNSVSAACDVAVYKQGQIQDILFSPILTFGIVRPILEFSYDANKQGEVTKTRIALKFLRYDKDLKEYSVYKTSYLNMLFFVIKENINTIKNTEKLSKDDLVKIFGDKDIYGRPKKSYKKIATTIIRFIYPSLYKEYKTLYK